MKKKIILTTIISLVLAIAVSAQTKPKDFSGVWTLDVSKSKFPDQMRVESMTMTVTQTDKEIKIERATKLAQGSALMRGGDGGNQTISYTLDGKEATADISGGMMSGKETRKATLTADGKLSLTTTRNIEGGKGGITIKTNETWEIDGNNLKVTRYMETPRGATNAELYFTKKEREGTTRAESNYTSPISSPPVASENIVRPPQDLRRQPMTDSSSAELSENSSQKAAVSETVRIPKMISAGVLNGKARSLPKPEYPKAARAVGAKGLVNVQVTIDESGKVIEAEAVSGDVALREACVEAAKQAVFAPTLLSGNPVKVRGIIVYNFNP